MLVLFLACSLSNPGAVSDSGAPSDGGADDGGTADGGAGDGGGDEGGDTGIGDGGNTGDGGSGDGGSGDGGDTGGCEVDWYADLDVDGWGGDYLTTACTGPAGSVPFGGDCDDLDGTRHPEADELCDGIDQDCNDLVDDDAVEALLLYEDLDGDLYGGEEALRCPTEGWIERGGDCDDGDPAISPAAEDVCDDGIDQDCSGLDLGCAIPAVYSVEDHADWTWEGSGQRLGYTLGSKGDFDGDGFDDLVMQSSTPPTTGGESRSDAALSIYYGGDLEPGDWTASDIDELDLTYSQYQMDFSADLDGDGAHELLWAGYTTDSTSILGIVWGGARLTPDRALAAEAMVQGADAYSFGLRFASGDVDGDGIDDVLATITSGAIVIRGSTTWEDSSLTDHPRVTGEDAWFGGGGVALGDLDGDGLDDLAVGDPYADWSGHDFPGAVHIVYSDGGMPGDVKMPDDADAVIRGPGSMGTVLLGNRLTAGDLDGDGADELVSASHSYDSAHGRAWVFAGGSRLSGEQDADELARATVTGDSITPLAVTVEVLPDIDGDAAGELMLGATNTGVLLYPGLDLSGSLVDVDATISMQGGDSDGYNGLTTTWGDLDGDGAPDPVTAAYNQGDYDGAVWAFSGAGL